MNVRVRIAPSPTGDPHIGTAYMALFNYAFAKKYNGKFILRIENTDLKRSSLASEYSILEYLKWLGLSWDEGPDIGGKFAPYRQSDRLQLYQSTALQLIKAGHAYYCTCSEDRLSQLRTFQMEQKLPTGYDQYCRDRQHKDGVLRMKIPPRNLTQFSDLLRGTISINNNDIDDQIILKSDGFPTYHLASIVDDHFMNISHVIRGEEWLSSTPKHVLLYKFLNWPLPAFIHLPLLRNSDKSKISKRKYPVSLKYFKMIGFLPEALLNFLGLISFSFKDGREVFTLHDFIENLDIKRISLGGPVFDFQKLNWLNSHYLKKKENTEVVKYLQEQLFSSNYLSQIVPLIKERINTSDQFLELSSFFFQNFFQIPINDESFKAINKPLLPIYESFFNELISLDSFSHSSIESLTTIFIEQHNLNRKPFFMTLRIIFTGKKESPPLFQTLEVLGRERCYIRLKNAIDILKD
ncbi:MAG: glutamate--tRNA ligase [Deltaproteobacteria bacterium]|nr:MAG: glutamate--tRNA ligase [Deltaproteobacteria bacterium]